jgi:hypothetical protein
VGGELIHSLLLYCVLQLGVIKFIGSVEANKVTSYACKLGSAIK